MAALSVTSMHIDHVIKRITRNGAQGWALSVRPISPLHCRIGDNMGQLILLYKLKDGVSQEEFHHWVKTMDYPAMRGLSRVKSFTTYKTEKLLMGEGAPSVDYVEVFDIPDLEGFISEDMSGDTVQSVMGAFMGFADAPEFIICDAIE